MMSLNVRTTMVRFIAIAIPASPEMEHIVKTGTSALLGQMTVMVLQCVTTHMAASDARANQDTSTMDPTALM